MSEVVKSAVVSHKHNVEGELAVVLLRLSLVIVNDLPA